MKRLLPALVLLLCFTACQREVPEEIPDNPPAPGGVSGSFTAKIDGVPWTAARGAFAHFAEAANGAPALLAVYGLSADKKLIGFTTADLGVHVYTLTDNSYSVGVFQDSSLADVNAFASNQSPVQPSGTINVRTIDTVKKTISGTFSFIAYRGLDNLKRNITEGVFTDIPYTRDVDLPAAAATDTLTAKVDGNLFAPYRINSYNMSITNSIMVQGASQTGGKLVGLVFPNDIVPGTYELDFFGTTHLGTYLSGTASLASTSGALKILEHNRTTKRVRGAFSFEANNPLAPSDTARITDGYFSVTYN